MASYNYHNQFTLAEVIKATSNFKDIIGEGGYGRVYYGILPSGQEVAVKVSDVESRFQITSYINEVHINI